MKILYVGVHGMGDIIMSLPTVRQILRAGHEIELLVKGNSEATIARQLMEKYEIPIHLMPRRGRKRVTRALSLIKRLRERKFDAAVAQYDVHPSGFAVLAFLSGIGTRIGWSGGLSFLNTMSMEIGKSHKIYENARCLAVLGIDSKSHDLLTPLLEDTENRRLSTIVLTPSAGVVAEHRAWPLDSYISLVDQLTGELGVNVEVLGGPEDHEICSRIVAATKSNAVQNLSGTLSVCDLVPYFRQRSLVVSCCNGLSHIAGIAGCTVVGLYGPTSASITGPLTSNLFPISADLSCSPCYRRGFEKGCGNPVCMSQIEVGKIYSVVKDIVAGSMSQARAEDNERNG